jgi:hypothetical protein
LTIPCSKDILESSIALYRFHAGFSLAINPNKSEFHLLLVWAIALEIINEIVFVVREYGKVIVPELEARELSGTLDDNNSRIGEMLVLVLSVAIVYGANLLAIPPLSSRGLQLIEERCSSLRSCKIDFGSFQWFVLIG